MIKNILITGSKGQLGSELGKLHTQYPEFKFLFTDIDELDLTDSNAVAQTVADHRIDYIINCAAYTAVDKAEDDWELCYKINRDAVRNLAEAAQGKANRKEKKSYWQSVRKVSFSERLGYIRPSEIIL